jgi:hypothetical protein
VIRAATGRLDNRVEGSLNTTVAVCSVAVAGGAR